MLFGLVQKNKRSTFILALFLGLFSAGCVKAAVTEDLNSMVQQYLLTLSGYIKDPTSFNNTEKYVISVAMEKLRAVVFASDKFKQLNAALQTEVIDDCNKLVTDLANLSPEDLNKEATTMAATIVSNIVARVGPTGDPAKEVISLTTTLTADCWQTAMTQAAGFLVKVASTLTKDAQGNAVGSLPSDITPADVMALAEKMIADYTTDPNLQFGASALFAAAALKNLANQFATFMKLKLSDFEEILKNTFKPVYDEILKIGNTLEATFTKDLPDKFTAFGNLVKEAFVVQVGGAFVLAGDKIKQAFGEELPSAFDKFGDIVKEKIIDPAKENRDLSLGLTVGLGSAAVIGVAAGVVGLGIKHFMDKASGLKTLRATLNGSMNANKLQNLFNMRNPAESMAEYVEALESRLVDLSDEPEYKDVLKQYRNSIKGLDEKAKKLLEDAIIDKPGNFRFSIEVVNALCQMHKNWLTPTDSHNVDISMFANALKNNDSAMATIAVTRDPAQWRNFVDWFRGTHRTVPAAD